VLLQGPPEAQLLRPSASKQGGDSLPLQQQQEQLQQRQLPQQHHQQEQQQQQQRRRSRTSRKQSHGGSRGRAEVIELQDSSDEEKGSCAAAIPNHVATKQEQHSQQPQTQSQQQLQLQQQQQQQQPLLELHPPLQVGVPHASTNHDLPPSILQQQGPLQQQRPLQHQQPQQHSHLQSTQPPLHLQPTQPSCSHPQLEEGTCLPINYVPATQQLSSQPGQGQFGSEVQIQFDHDLLQQQQQQPHYQQGQHNQQQQQPHSQPHTHPLQLQSHGTDPIVLMPPPPSAQRQGMGGGGQTMHGQAPPLSMPPGSSCTQFYTPPAMQQQQGAQLFCTPPHQVCGLLMVTLIASAGRKLSLCCFVTVFIPLYCSPAARPGWCGSDTGAPLGCLFSTLNTAKSSVTNSFPHIALRQQSQGSTAPARCHSLCNLNTPFPQ